MSPGWVLGSLAALSWLALDVQRKRLSERMEVIAAACAMMLLHLPLILPCLLVGQWLQTGSRDPFWQQQLLPAFPSLTLDYGLWFSASLVLNTLANYLFFRSVKLSPLSLTTPYLALTPVFAALTSLLLGQTPSAWGVLGIAIVVLGALLLNPGDSERGWRAPLYALLEERGSLYMVAVAVIWGITPALDRQAADHSSVLAHTMLLSVGMGLVFLGFASRRLEEGARGLPAMWRGSWGLLIGVALCSVLASALQLIAYGFIPIAYVEVLKRAVGVLGAVLIGYLFFGERERLGGRLVGVVTLGVGVAVILLRG